MIPSGMERVLRPKREIARAALAARAISCPLVVGAEPAAERAY
jgi:hypothetical protein